MSPSRLSERALSMPRSGVREAMALASQVGDAIRLDIGDPDFPTPAHVVEAALRAASQGFTHYGPSAGLPSLRALLAEKVRARNRLPCLPEQVVVTSGGCGALFLSFLALLDPGEEVLVPDPGWSHYVPMAVAVGARPVHYPLDRASGFQPDPDALRRLMGRKARAIVVNSPANPTGSLLSPESLARVLELASERGVWIISDECYEELVLEGEHVSAAGVGHYDRVVTVFSFSKTYAMTGWRVGYAVAPPEVAQALAHLQEPVLSCPSTVAQKAAEAALQGPQDVVLAMREAYRRRRDALLAALDGRGVAYERPRGTFYAMVDVARGGLPSQELARRLLAEERVAVVPGSAFGPGGEGMVRVALTAPEERLREAADRIARMLDSLAEAA